MFEKHNQSGYEEALEGVQRKTLAYGQHTVMVEFVLKQGSVLPKHAHPHEQTGYLVRGRLRLSIGAKEHEAHAGDSWCVPGDTEHGAVALEDSVAIEVFSPVRKDYIPRTT